MPTYPELQLFIAGEWKSADGQPVLNPADESVLGLECYTVAKNVSHLFM
jgi:succinate-semialdehyde dehydrogenase / glutarate-semialdehyde dehydrogenase